MTGSVADPDLKDPHHFAGSVIPRPSSLTPYTIYVQYITPHPSSRIVTDKIKHGKFCKILEKIVKDFEKKIFFARPN